VNADKDITKDSQLSSRERYVDWLSEAVEIAEAAGDLLIAHWLKEHDVRQKGFRNIVTDADIAAETMILSRLREAFPDHAVIAEESGDDGLDASVHWLVDPLDGTTNFSRNNPNFSVTLAAVEDRQRTVVGVVYDPIRRHRFTAYRGGGAKFNDRPIQCSGVSEIERCVFSVDWPRDPGLREEMWLIVGNLLAHGRTLRALGSAAMNMVYVAAGWLDFYVGMDLKPWDHAAPGLIVQEAGGTLETLSGTPATPFIPDPLLAATPELIQTFRELRESKRP
jgi:myo-inositol-1(or 4)-monophosphatase